MDALADRAGPPGAPVGSWAASPVHRAWLREQVLQLLLFFRPTLTRQGRFVELDDDGLSMAGRGERVAAHEGYVAPQDILVVARAVHCYAAGELLGVPGCGTVVEAGLQALWDRHRDAAAGGYFSSVGPEGPADASKTAYNHAFVLLAASTALAAGHDATRLLEDTLRVIEEHFWSEIEGASREAFDRNWAELEAYRGANSNMHLTESLLAASDVTGRTDLAARAERVASKLVHGFARGRDWLLPEHYTAGWEPVLTYNRDRGDDRFRPYGAIVGHSIEWARLVLGAGIATRGLGNGWYLPAAEALFGKAVRVGWDRQHGGLAYTVDWDESPANPDHYWWPVAEAIGTSSYLLRLTGSDTYELWYRRFWDFASNVLIDHRRGGWYPLFDANNAKKTFPWSGKPDLYHALQACLFPMLPLAPSLAGAIKAMLTA